MHCKEGTFPPVFKHIISEPFQWLVKMISKSYQLSNKAEENVNIYFWL